MGLLIGSLLGGVTVPVGLPGGTTATLALAALVAVTALLLAVASQVMAPRLSWSALRSATRQWSEQTIFLRLRDPDAAGRPRPRAPSVQPTAA
ncbi:MAG TPA: DUF6412 domain-containing protein [Jiangellaceae bacterium]|jgi:hypothetical protein|nr:DUF6412 domain-containing protein [Jiangellaceae bacterium]